MAAVIKCREVLKRFYNLNGQSIASRQVVDNIGKPSTKHHNRFVDPGTPGCHQNQESSPSVRRDRAAQENQEEIPKSRGYCSVYVGMEEERQTQSQEPRKGGAW